MDSLKAFIRQVDDDYLAGLANKGILKRAYKDLEQEKSALLLEESPEGEAKVTLKEVRCVLRMPLAESACSCPSHSICRHIITAVLWMKGELAAETQTAGHTGDGEQEQDRERPGEPALLSELLEIPLQQLKRSLGNKRYALFLSHMQAGDGPALEETSIVTVTFPWEKETVKLLEPVSYSSCTCHSKELCAHKAQAILAYQLCKNRYTMKELEALREPEQPWDQEQASQACEGIRREICRQLCTGLSRASGENAESLLRLSVIAHRAALPGFESALREASACYEQYFSRSAAFRTGELMEKLLALDQRALLLLRSDEGEERRALAGSFRDTYVPAGTLHLMGMGARAFSGKAGYEGEIYYFLETERKAWYTWTDARPTFYEGRTTPRRGMENAQAPWGLNCSRQQLQSLVFDLKNARTAQGGRLSVSMESQGEARGVRSPDLREIREAICWDYEKMLPDYQEKGEARERLVLAGALRWEEACFDKVKQGFRWDIYDKRDRRLSIALNYTKEEGLLINLLERLEQRLRKKQPEAIVFLGSFYLDEEGRPCLYPIEFFMIENIGAEAFQTRDQERRKEEEDFSSLPSPEVIGSMEQYFGEVKGLLEDLFVSGLSSVQEETLRQCKRLSEEGEQMGLHRAGRELSAVYRSLEGRRHRMEFSPEPVPELLGRLQVYMGGCRERLLRDKALRCMADGENVTEERRKERGKYEFG